VEVGPRWYSVGRNLELLELDGRRQAAVGVVVEAGLGEEGEILSLGHVCWGPLRRVQRKRRRQSRRR
jgi:hypothetical protein